jgi:hypothetical protein
MMATEIALEKCNVHLSKPEFDEIEKEPVRPFKSGRRITEFGLGMPHNQSLPVMSARRVNSGLGTHLQPDFEARMPTR